jgi:hypothetical protein
MSPVLSRPRSPAFGEHRSRLGVAAGVAAVLIVVALAFVLTRLGSDPSVSDIHLDNPTSYDLTVEVASSHRDSWTQAGTARRETTTDLLQVGDQGKTWVFRFSYGGTQAAEITVPRSTLERDGWKLRVPDSAGTVLAGAGITPPP